MGTKLWRSLCDASLENAVNELIGKCSLPRPVAILLATRGIKPDKVESFFKPTLKDLSDPYRFPGVTKAVERLWSAIQNREVIMIHGDYDTDGITAAALLSAVLRENGATVESFLPHRFDDGYGFTPESLRKSLEAVGSNCRVLVTVDCGINSVDAVKEAEKLGIDVIITDHHEPAAEIPPALAVLNPKLYQELSDLQLLSGAGMAFKLCHAFVKYGRENNLGGFATKLEDILDLVALGTIADIVPLLGENRILVKTGMKVLRKQLRPGIRALIETSKISTKLKPSDITFKLAPRLNAAGRLGNANAALELLNSLNIVDAYKYADMLEKYNTQRQEKEQEIYEEARKQIDAKINVDECYSILVAGDDWHQGVIGIVASRLARDFNRPVIVLTIQGNEANGSGRSIGTLNLVDVLSKSAHLLDRFGGHPMAVGLGLQRDKIPKFYEEIEKNIRLCLTRDDLVDQIQYDGVVELFELNEEFFKYLDSLGPFGHSNARPTFLLKNLQCHKIYPLGPKHSRGILRDRKNAQMEFIAFNRSIDSFPQTELDVIACPQINEYHGESRPQLQIMDIQPC